MKNYEIVQNIMKCKKIINIDNYERVYKRDGVNLLKSSNNIVPDFILIAKACP